MRIILLGIHQNVNFMINRKQLMFNSNLQNIKHKQQLLCWNVTVNEKYLKRNKNCIMQIINL